MLQSIARLMAPPHCVHCRREGQLLCLACAATIPVARSQCFWCAASTTDGRTCIHCRPTMSLAGVTVASAYDGIVRELIGRLKYHHQREAAVSLARLLAPLLHSQFDAITAVPVATTRLRQRSYNQAELIAKHIARGLTLPYRPLLRRLHNTQQVGKSRLERLEHVHNVFTARDAPKRILIVDDVLTTGATLNACAQALTKAGAEIVWAAAAARD